MATCGLALALLTACAPKSYTVRHPAPSDIVFGNPPASAPLTLVDARPDGERVFSSGILPAELHSPGLGLFLFGEVCTVNGQAEFGNLMLSKLRITKR